MNKITWNLKKCTILKEKNFKKEKQFRIKIANRRQFADFIKMSLMALKMHRFRYGKVKKKTTKKKKRKKGSLKHMPMKSFDCTGN